MIITAQMLSSAACEEMGPHFTKIQEEVLGLVYSTYKGDRGECYRMT